ncbi:putative nuclease HARBI1 [Centruroides vittatus]
MEDKYIISSAVTAFCNIFNDNAMISYKRKMKHDDDDELLHVNVAAMEENKKRKKAKIIGYVEEVVPLYSMEDFKSHFRLNRSTVEHLMQMIISKPNKRKPSMKREDSILLSLWLIGNQESFRGVADRFGIGQGHAHREFIAFCKDIMEITERVIQWPTGGEIEKTVSEFNELRGSNSFPGVLGCIDGTHIPFTAPKNEKVAHFNRKNFTSVILQAVCDAKLKFIDVFAGWPGSSNDARVFQRSPLFLKMKHNPEMIPENYHLLGDSAYPLSKKLLTPYRDNGHLNYIKKYYNKILSSTRIVIEQAFGQLFGRFRRLKHLHMFRRDLIPEVIITGCVLHNLCILYNDIPPDACSINDNFQTSSPNFGEEYRDGISKREKIANKIYAHHNG